MNIYLAGRIAGDPDYREKFKRAAARLWNAPDICVLNPSKLPGGMSRADYMSICLPMLLRADRAVFLEDWRDSAGARIEYALAAYVGIPIVDMAEDPGG